MTSYNFQLRLTGSQCVHWFKVFLRIAYDSRRLNKNDKKSNP